MITEGYKAIVVCGSAGSMPIILSLIESLPSAFSIPLVLIIHRQKNIVSEMANLFETVYSNKKIIEPNDKDAIAAGNIYLAPQNYHLLFESDKTFSLDYSEAVHHSRPAFDVSFESAARVFKQHLLAILLSGANHDGTEGLRQVLANNGAAIVQDPATAQYPAMPRFAINKNPGVQVLQPKQINSFIKDLSDHT